MNFLIECTEQNTESLLSVPAQDADPKSMYEKMSDKCKCQHILQYLAYSPQKCQGHKSQEKMEKLLQTEGE